MHEFSADKLAYLKSVRVLVLEKRASCHSLLFCFIAFDVNIWASVSLLDARLRLFPGA
jgi:hypothetical protein